MLYVAMTRAIHALHMIVQPQAKSGKLPKTYAGLLRAALCDGKPLEPGQIGYECGDSCWYESTVALEDREREQPAAAATASPPRRIEFAKFDGQRRDFERVSPSQLEGGQKISLLDVFRAPASAARHHGTLVHAWMQLLDWADERLPSDNLLAEAAARLAGEIGDVTAEQKTLVASWKQAVQQPGIKAALSRSFYDSPTGFDDPHVVKWCKAGQVHLEVQTERPFAVSIDEQLLVGTIDRLVLIRVNDELVAADVIDFKTDQLSTKNPQGIDERVNFYRPQLAAYRRAVAKLYSLPLTRIATRLAFLSVGEVRTLKH
jgi:ATP-dependent helicase/nuclease subunit A